MLITTAALAMNIAIGFTAWQSQLQLAAKIIITLVLLVKAILFFCSVWMSDGGAMTRWGIAACIVLNIALFAYALFVKEMLLIITTAGAGILLLIWAFGVIFDFRSK